MGGRNTWWNARTMRATINFPGAESHVKYSMRIPSQNRETYSSPTSFFSLRHIFVARSTRVHARAGWSFARANPSRERQCIFNKGKSISPRLRFILQVHQVFRPRLADGDCDHVRHRSSRKYIGPRKEYTRRLSIWKTLENCKEPINNSIQLHRISQIVL